MPLFSIPVYRFHPHDLVYWSSVPEYDRTIILSRSSGGVVYPANDRLGDVILNQGGAGTTFSIPAATTEAVCRTIESNLADCTLETEGSVYRMTRLLRLTAGEVRTAGGASKSLVIDRMLTAGDGVADATLTFVNDYPGLGTFSVSFVEGASLPPPLFDPSASGDLSVVIGDGVDLSKFLNLFAGSIAPWSAHSGGTTVNAGGKLSLHTLTGVVPGISESSVFDVSVAGELHVTMSSNAIITNAYMWVTLQSTVATTGGGKLTVSGGYVTTATLGLIHTAVYLASGCTVAMDTIDGVICGVGTITGPVEVRVGGFIASGGRYGTALGTLTVNGALTLNGGGLVVTKGGSGLNKVVVTGAFTATSVSQVYLWPGAAGTYVIVEAASITGTLPDPTGMSNFSHYNYNATSIEIVLM